MRPSRFHPLLILGLVSAQMGVAAELVGLRNIALEPDERVWGFDIQLKEGRIAALNKIPEGWKITAENFGEAGGYKDGGGEVQASAGLGHDAFSAEDLTSLGAFLLVDESAVHHARAVLSGFIKTSGPRGDRKLRLLPENFTRKEVGEGGPNKSPEATTLACTPAADAPVAPAGGRASS